MGRERAFDLPGTHARKFLASVGCLLSFTASLFAFSAAKPVPLEKYTSLECAVVKEKPPSRHDRDPVYKIVVSLTLDDSGNVENLVVVHHTRSGETYNRDDQYVNSNLRQTPGKTDYYWTGTRAEHRSLTMRGNLWRSRDNKWHYSEELFKSGRLQYSMLSACHIDEPGS